MDNLLVPGGSGFIGSNFIRYLLEDTDFKGRIINLDKLTYAGNPENLAGLEEKYPSRYIFIKADICSMDAIEPVFRAYSIDTICHFAAESHVDRSIVGPSDFIYTNIIGTFNLLECARKYQDSIKLFHHVSTDERV
jgi:dTDP-glucose 4,6-dehydratase